jgi:putative PIN family toxin of toxin-antitoxin system
MPEFRRIVVDTNVVVSGLLFPRSELNLALRKAQSSEMLVSEATKIEFIGVMARSKFDRYVDVEVRRQLAAEYIRGCQTIPVHSEIHACRDPKDDKYLALAVDGRADLILTGDRDLLALHPFRGIPILTPTQYLDESVTSAI